MGQAKERKKLEPNYGKIKKPTKMRGLIISPPITIKDNKEILNFESFFFDPQDLRFSLFFWDRLSWPKPEIDTMPHPIGQEAHFLYSAGILERPIYNNLGCGAKAKIRGYASTLENYEIKDPGMWALGNGTNSVTTDSEYFEQNKGAAIELLRCVPIPRNDVPLNDILEFRHKRRDELLLFRQHIESLAAEVSGANDSADAFLKAKAQLDSSCKNLIITTKEWQLPVYISDYEASFNVDITKAISSFTQTSRNLSTLGLDETSVLLGSLAAGLQSQISLKGKPRFRPFKKSRSPYGYAYSISKAFQIN